MIIDRQIIDDNGKRSVIELIVINDGRNDNFYIRNTPRKVKALQVIPFLKLYKH